MTGVAGSTAVISPPHRHPARKSPEASLQLRPCGARTGRSGPGFATSRLGLALLDLEDGADSRRSDLTGAGVVASPARRLASD